MKQVLLEQGKVVVNEVPAPQVMPGTVLVRTLASCISIGTELSGVKASNLPLWKRALKRPDQVKRVIAMARSEGFGRASEAVRSHLSQAQPMGYSLAGTVIAVGEGVDDLFPGDRVACAGSQAAYHAEFVCVPRNLAVPVPEGVADEHASTVALGAIALQGIRRAEPTLGETFVVVGLGMLGQLTCRMLRSSGIRTVGADRDIRRVNMARAAGLDVALEGNSETHEQELARLTGGMGADAVIVTAASDADDLLGQAFRMCRRKGRVVLVGDVPIRIERADIYAKEIDFRISASYGPGRYDRNFEERGLDYPAAYVRWTESRNMEAYLGLLASGAVKIGDLIEARYGIAEASSAYQSLQSAEPKRLGVVLTYPRDADQATMRRIAAPAVRQGTSRAVRLAVVGAGGFAKSTLLPIVQQESERFTLQAICSRQGHTAAAAAKQFGAASATTNYAEVLADKEVDAVMIATRHDLHATMTLEALKAGKHVFVEKPLCIRREELDAIAKFHDAAGNRPLLMTGFNRRFSPHAAAIAEAAVQRTNPMMINYRVNAGHVPRDSWLQQAEGGGRNIGEACHFYDLFVKLTGSQASSVQANAIRPATGFYAASDNFAATIGFADGSVAALTYTALGDTGYPKEFFEVFFDGKVFAVDDFKRMTVAGAKDVKAPGGGQDKGHRQELIAFADAVRRGTDWPIPIWQQIEAMRIAFEVEDRIRMGASDGSVRA